MANQVGVYQSALKYYSEHWQRADDFPEKEALRVLSRLLGYKNGNFLSEVVHPGDRVVVKPNWVMDRHPSGMDVFSMITHSAVIRAVVDLAYEAMHSEGEIVIADAPQWDCDFDNLLRITQIERIADYYRAKYGFHIPIRDLRQIRCVTQDGYIKAKDRIKLVGDPEGYAVVDLGEQSAFIGMPEIERLYGADYDRQETIKHHNNRRHEYLVSKTILGTDVIINVPKLKVHKKVGVTVNAKGMVGINGNKNWVAHYRIGDPTIGGDEYPASEAHLAKAKARSTHYLIDRLLTQDSVVLERVFNSIYGIYKRLKPLIDWWPDHRVSVDAGNWYGNDTAWRMTADLALAVLYADRDGQISHRMQRHFFSVVDGIMAGEKDGPLNPTPKPCGVIVAGDNLLMVDLVCTRLMGFDYRKTRSLRWLTESCPLPMGVDKPEQIRVRSNIPDWESLMTNPLAADLAFEPHQGWKGHIELDGQRVRSGEMG